MDSQFPNLFRSFRDGMALARQRNLRLLSLLGRLLTVVVWLGALLFTALNFWTAWPNYITGLPRLGGPESPMLLLDIAVSVMLFPTIFAVRQRFSQTFTTFAKALRNAVAARDASVAPAADVAQADRTAETQPEEHAPNDVEIVGPLAHPLEAFGTAEVIYLLGALVGLALLAASIYFLVNTPTYNWLFVDAEPLWWQPDSFVFAAVGCIAGLSLSVWMLSIWRWARMERRGLVAEVDADGLTVRGAGRGVRRQHLRWSDMRGFAQMRYRDNGARTHTIYLLSTADEDLLWDDPPVSRYSSPSEVARAKTFRATARRLAQVVAQRAGLPLLDISGIVGTSHLGAYGIGVPAAHLFDYALTIARVQGDMSLAANLWQGTHPGAGESPKRALTRLRPSSLFLYTTAEQRADIVRYALALLPYYPTAEQETPDPRERLARRRQQRRQQWESVFVLMTLVGACAIFGACAGLQTWYTPSQLRALPAQARAQTPVYLAPFSAPQSDWLTRAAVGDDTRSARFTSRGYELTASDPDQAEGVWTQFITRGDSAVQVTIKLSDADEAAGGILLNVSADGSRAVAFTVDRYGDSHLLKCHDLNTAHGACDEEVEYAYADGIDMESGAATLLVIRRGQMYIFSVNDTPILIFRDTTNALGARGSIGVYLDKGAATADFTDLAVYPAPAQLPFWVR